jgi:hypothetical protein
MAVKLNEGDMIEASHFKAQRLSSAPGAKLNTRERHVRS